MSGPEVAQGAQQYLIFEREKACLCIAFSFFQYSNLILHLSEITGLKETKLKTIAEVCSMDFKVTDLQNFNTAAEINNLLIKRCSSLHFTFIAMVLGLEAISEECHQLFSFV